MDTLKNWSARRSGGRITINGSRHGGTLKVPNVDTIVCRDGKVIATDKDGATYQLLT